MTTRHAWWGELRHGGMLVAPAVLDAEIAEPQPLAGHAYDRLRLAWLKRLASADRGAAREFTAAVVGDYLRLAGWQKAGAVDPRFKATAMTGESLRPDWALADPLDETQALLLVTFDGADRLGVGRGRKSYARLVELLRATGAPLGLLTNGTQLRLVHAGPDYDAWAEWDAATWFDEGDGRARLDGLAALIGDADRLRALIAAIHDSRSRQGDLAQVLGEQVRQGVELILGAVDAELTRRPDLHDALLRDAATGTLISDDELLGALYQAGTRIVMRLVLALYAESRDLLPAGNEAYHGSYGVESLFRALGDGARDGAEMADEHSAWRRILALFRLIHDGSPHPDLAVPAYGGQLFRAGRLDSPDPIARALAAIEQTTIDDATVLRVLRLLKVGKVRIRRGRGAAWVAGSVDFSDLRTEYIGIVYEGLIDYELRRAPADDPIVFLGVGRQPALPLSRLRALGGDELKKLLKAFKKDASKVIDAGDQADDEGEDDGRGDDDPDDDAEDDDPEADIDVEADDGAAAVAETVDAEPRAAALAWARSAVVQAKLVRAPRGRNADIERHERQIDERARALVRAVVAPGRVYLVASGGLRKGSGSFYTRPALSVPLAHRTLEPLCYRREGERLVPRRPDEILALKVCEPAMGSGSFLVAALRYLVEALARSLHHHDLIRPGGDDTPVVTLPFGTPSEAKESEPVLPLAPDDDRFEERLRAVLARHVVERCLYGVDRNPMAVELAKLSLWVETLDRELPFEFLDHKLKVGNSLVGCWLHLVEDYPVRALEREDGGGSKSGGTKWLKARFKEAKGQLPDVVRRLDGATSLLDDVATHPAELVEGLRGRFAAIHDLPPDIREGAYRELRESGEYLTLRDAMDAWCALWFWPAGDDSWPRPRAWGSLDDAARAGVRRASQRSGFFHWEVEFPDVFGAGREGFDAILGNPPWEIAKPNSQEFFSRHDPLYRTYGKTEALAVQRRLFDQIPGLAAQWLEYQSGFKALSGFVKASADPFGVPLPGGKSGAALAAAWDTIRDGRQGNAHRAHPYRHQGSADLNTYKLFLEMAHHLARRGGRLGMLVPSGVYTDKGSTDLRRLFLERCRWEWLFGFENVQRTFPIESRFKFAPVVIQRGGSTTSVRAAFMRRDVREWERAEDHVIDLHVSDIRRFAPSTWSFMELQTDRDLEVVERLYGEHELLGEFCERAGTRYRREFDMTNAAKHFTPRKQLAARGLIQPDDDTRDPRVRARLRVAGYLPLYEGKSFYLHNPYALGKGQQDSVGKFVATATIAAELDSEAWGSPRLVFRDIARSTDQRTLLPSIIAPAAHGNKAPSLDGLDNEWQLAGLFGSLVLDYVIRMKVSASLNWFYVETLPIPRWSGTDYEARAEPLVRSLNAVGADFPDPAEDPLVEPADRLAARLLLDALVADLYGLRPDDLAHIATRFPIYDKHAGEHRYTNLVLPVYEAMVAGGPDAAANKAAELAAARGDAGVGFGLDELWQPEDGWAQANREAREILARAGATV